MNRRIEKINEVLRREIGQLILENIDFGRKILITVNRVDVAPDLSEAKVYVSVLPDSFINDILPVLRRRSVIFHKMLNKVMRIRKVPRLNFCEEKNLQKAAHIDELLHRIDNNKAR